MHADLGELVPCVTADMGLDGRAGWATVVSTTTEESRVRT
jgi:hypothetical protein